MNDPDSNMDGHEPIVRDRRSETLTRIDEYTKQVESVVRRLLPDLSEAQASNLERMQHWITIEMEPFVAAVEVALNFRDGARENANRAHANSARLQDAASDMTHEIDSLRRSNDGLSKTLAEVAEQRDGNAALLKEAQEALEWAMPYVTACLAANRGASVTHDGVRLEPVGEDGKSDTERHLLEAVTDLAALEAASGKDGAALDDLTNALAAEQRKLQALVGDMTWSEIAEATRLAMGVMYSRRNHGVLARLNLGAAQLAANERQGQN